LSAKSPSEKLREIDVRLAEIESEKTRLLDRKKQLLATNQLIPSSRFSLAQKVEIFRRLFRGRTDVFATRWENAQGRSGYAVACHNEWVTGVCNKPKVKCGDCPNRHYKTLDEQVIYDHLAGKHVVGLYPLLPDSTCHFLAVDFDKDEWKDTVLALAHVCRQFDVPYAIEVSRSGNGAHLWIFFSEAIQAGLARRLGFGLLDKAMEIHAGLSFESYDRLFPNQDLMPEGGFGNLIALPLQQEKRQQGKTIFVDDHLRPIDDQWEFLAGLNVITTDSVDRLADDLAPQNLVVPLAESPFTEALSAETTAPWEQSLRIDHDKIPDCPRKIAIALSNHIYIKLSDIPAKLTARLRRVASFSNPVFFKKQAMRFSTHGTPRYITCARIGGGYLSLPRGCLDDVVSLLDEQGIDVEFDDKRIRGTLLDKLSFIGELRSDQQEAVERMGQYDTGILHAPTAFGKTVAAIGVISHRKVSTLILTHSRQLLDQWKERLGSFVSGVEVGVVGGGKKRPSGEIDIATYQSLIDKKNNLVSDLIDQYGQVIIDECHHISAPRYEMVLNEVKARYVMGLTATPNRQDGHQKIMFMVAGPVRQKVKSDVGSNFEQQVIVRRRYDPVLEKLNQVEEKLHISAVYRSLVENASRNRQIIDDVLEKVHGGAHCLVLTERREHAEILSQSLRDQEIVTVVLRGAMRAKEQAAAEELLDDAQVIVATGKYIGEGFDLPRLDTLFLALPIAWKGTLAQYAGRIHREAEGKDMVTIYDYVDSSVPMLNRMFNKREKGYKAMGYDIQYGTADQNMNIIEYSGNGH